MKWLMTNNFSPRALTQLRVRGEKLVGRRGVAVKDLRRETATSCGGRPGFFPWPTTPFAASHNKLWLWLSLNGMNFSRYNLPEESPCARLREILARKIGALAGVRWLERYPEAWSVLV
jgi:hypothetical protein